jgi:hypothetical protein
MVRVVAGQPWFSNGNVMQVLLRVGTQAKFPFATHRHIIRNRRSS